MSQIINRNKISNLLSVVFFFSGFASLIYQVVWQRLLTLHYGIGSISTTLIVGVYMAGLGIGSWVGGILSERVKKQVVLYFWVEMGIGIFGIFSLSFIGLLGRTTAGSPYLLSGLYMFIFLCIPTFLMGITLPLLTKIFSQFSKNFIRTVSYLYFINTIGAAIGALITSYILISFFGLDVAVHFAVLINFTLVLLIWVANRLIRKSPVEIETESDPKDQSCDGGLGNWAYLLIFVTGFLAMGYEIVWYRLIGVLVKDSPYAFSTILSVYLLGIALGSLAINRYLSSHPTTNRKQLFFIIQFLIGFMILASLIGFYYFTRYTGFSQLTQFSFSNYLHPDPKLLDYLPRHIPPFILVYSYLDIFFWPFFFLFIPTFLMGAGFPLASSLAVKKKNEEGYTVGVVYLFNIMGNVLGSVLTGFVILPLLGSERTFLVMALTSISGLLLAAPKINIKWSFPIRFIVVGIITYLSLVFFPHKGEIYRVIHPAPQGIQQVINEGIDAVVVSYHDNGPTSDFINGQEHGRFGATWYNAWVTEAAIYAPSLQNVLVIGFGSGTFPAILEDIDDLEKLTVVELCPTLIKNQKDIPFYQKMLSDPRMMLVIEDGRRFLLQNEEKYDLILMDPVRTTTSHANNLHSRQFFELTRQHLKPGGVLLIGGLNEERVVPKTIASVYKNVRIYDLFTIASDAPLIKNLEREKEVYESLPEPIRDTVREFVSTNYRGDQSFISRVAATYPVNDEWKPITEYYLGMKTKERLNLFIHDPD
ncbi:MAG: fused MFS/spermidine synthase [Anaerolineaceae bacterium]